MELYCSRLLLVHVQSLLVSSCPHQQGHTESLERVQKFALKLCTKSWDSSYDGLLNSCNLPTIDYLCVLICTSIYTFTSKSLNFCACLFVYCVSNHAALYWGQGVHVLASIPVFPAPAFFAAVEKNEAGKPVRNHNISRATNVTQFALALL